MKIKSLRELCNKTNMRRTWLDRKMEEKGIVAFGMKKGKKVTIEKGMKKYIEESDLVEIFGVNPYSYEIIGIKHTKEDITPEYLKNTDIMEIEIKVDGKTYGHYIEIGRASCRERV